MVPSQVLENDANTQVAHTITRAPKTELAFQAQREIGQQ